MTRTFFAVSLLLASSLAAAPAAEVAPGVHLLPGSFVPGPRLHALPPRLLRGEPPARRTGEDRQAVRRLRRQHAPSDLPRNRRRPPG